MNELLGTIKRSVDAYDKEAARATQRMGAIVAGGIDGIGIRGERTLFDVIAQWVRDDDPRAQKISVSVDGQRRHIVFTGRHVDTDNT